MACLRYYINGHGLGHASRSCRILQSLALAAPQVEVEVVSCAPEWFFAQALPRQMSLSGRQLGVGVLQEDSLVMREQDTLEACTAFHQQQQDMAAAEAQSLAASGVDLVVADIPSLAFAAAAKAGVPGVGVANFTWDWIYAGMAAKYPGYEQVVAAERQAYAQGDLLLRLPFCGPGDAFAQVEDVPLVARRARQDREAVRLALDISPRQQVALLSFGGFGLQDVELSAAAELKDWVFLLEARDVAGHLPSNFCSLPPGMFWYPDLMAAADVVLTKPGYGIVSEAIANNTAVIYTCRGDFREQQLLVDALKSYTRCCYISNEQLRHGQWRQALDAVMDQPPPADTPPMHGEKVVVKRLLDFLS